MKMTLILHLKENEDTILSYGASTNIYLSSFKNGKIKQNNKQLVDCLT
jgi:hypothetical protein